MRCIQRQHVGDRKQTSVLARPSAESEATACKLQTFVDKCATSERLGKHIAASIGKSIVSGGPDSVAVTRECVTMESTLPIACKDYVRVPRAFDMIEDLALKLKSGRSTVSLADIHDALAELHWAGNGCKATATTRLGFKDEAAKVSDEHAGLLVRMTKACEMIDAKCGMVHEAVTHWDFKKMPWIFKGKDGADASITSAGKLVEQFHAQFDDLNH